MNKKHFILAFCYTYLSARKKKAKTFIHLLYVHVLITKKTEKKKANRILSLKVL